MVLTVMKAEKKHSNIIKEAGSLEALPCFVSFRGVVYRGSDARDMGVVPALWTMPGPQGLYTE